MYLHTGNCGFVNWFQTCAVHVNHIVFNGVVCSTPDLIRHSSGVRSMVHARALESRSSCSMQVVLNFFQRVDSSTRARLDSAAHRKARKLHFPAQCHCGIGGRLKFAPQLASTGSPEQHIRHSQKKNIEWQSCSNFCFRFHFPANCAEVHVDVLPIATMLTQLISHTYLVRGVEFVLQV